MTYEIGYDTIRSSAIRFTRSSVLFSTRSCSSALVVLVFLAELAGRH